MLAWSTMPQECYEGLMLSKFEMGIVMRDSVPLASSLKNMN